MGTKSYCRNKMLLIETLMDEIMIVALRENEFEYQNQSDHYTSFG